MLRRRIATATAGAATTAAHALQQSLQCLLEQQEELLHHITPEQYMAPCPKAKSSVGGHLRHSLDHISPPLEAALNSNYEPLHYDRRSRNTAIEHDVHKALDEITNIHQSLVVRLHRVKEAKLEQAIKVHFMLTAEGKETEFQSTLGRELAFAIHHCIHHHAMIRLIVQENYATIRLSPTFGMAPSTSNFLHLNRN